jgi:hypothetical protein
MAGPNPPIEQTLAEGGQSSLDAQTYTLPFAPHVLLQAATGWPWVGWLMQHTSPRAQFDGRTHVSLAAPP